MKQICVLLAIVLCLGACGTEFELPTETQAITVEITTEALATPSASQEKNSEQSINEIFLQAITLYEYLNHGTLACDYEDRFGYGDWEYDRWEYACVTDPRYPSIAALETAVREIFSEELTQSYLSLTVESQLSNEADEVRREIERQRPLLVEREGKLYTFIQSRGGNLMLESISIETQSESKIVYALHATNPWEGEPEVSERYYYTRELIDSKWVFTIFPADWI